MANQLYVLVLDGDASRKVHAPDCPWVAGVTAKGEAGSRRYGLRSAGSVDGVDCRRCGGTAGPETGSWPIQESSEGVGVLAPEVVIREAIRQFRERIDVARVGLMRLSSDWKSSIRWFGSRLRNQRSLERSQPVTSSGDNERLLRRRRGSEPNRVAPVPEVSQTEMLLRVIERRAPRESDERTAFTDTVVWLTVSREILVVVSLRQFHSRSQ